MRITLPILSAALALAALWSTATPADAASRSAVLAACSRTQGCGYTKNKDNGDISGCSLQSGKCFYCPNDGKKQCFGVGRTLPPPGKLPKITNDAVVLTK